MATQDERNFSKGIDLDSDERFIAQGDYRYGRNGRSGTSDQDFIGSVECMRGNVLRNTLRQPLFPDIPYPFPVGTNKIIGTIEDVKYQTIIYFLWNSGNNHRIIRYYLKEKVLRNVIPLTWSTAFNTLNFQQNNKIWNGKIVYAGEQDYIIWTDGFNPVRKLRLDVGTAYSGLGISALSQQLIDFAKQPPQIPPTTSLVSSSVNTFTVSRGFQFAIRYVYDDNSITTLSPYSNVQFVNEEKQSIRVSFNSGHYTVKQIQLLAREGNGVGGEGTTNPAWYIVAKIPRTANASPTTYTFDFTNTELKEPVARIDSDKLFESIPELAGCMELSETNQVVLGDITEGKDNPELDYTAELISTNDPLSTLIDTQYGLGRAQISGFEINKIEPIELLNRGGLSAPQYTNYDNRQIFLTAGTYVSNATFSANVKITCYNPNISDTRNFTLRVLIVYNGQIKTQDIAYSVLALSSQTQTFNIVWDEILLIRPGDSFDVVYAWVSGDNPANIAISPVDLDNGLYISGERNAQVVACFKENSTARVGIQYYDAELRSGGIMPLSNVLVLPITPTDFWYQPIVRVTIRSRPPIWAHYWSVCVKETDSDYAYFYVKSVEEDAKIRVTIPSNFEQSFIPEAGDYFRLIKTGSTVDVLIDSYDPDTQEITLSKPPTVTIANNDRFEVYRKTSVSNFYFEQRFEPVGNPELVTRRHVVRNPQTGEQSQSGSSPSATPAFIKVNGDSYNRLVNGIAGYSKTYSPLYESNYWNKGRPAIEITNGGSKRLINGLRWGGQLFPNTFVNNMSVFDSGNYAAASQGFGIINALRLRGYTLKIIQEGNTSSAYLNRRNITNADGSEQLVLTDSLITQINPSQQYQGTLHKGSVMLYNDDLYFFDAINGLVIRDSENGQVAISDYGAQRYFRQLGELTRELGSDVDIYAGYDEKTKQLFLTTAYLDPSNELIPETISFEEKNNRWKFFHDYYLESGDIKTPIDMYSKMGQNMFMFINGRIWESNELVDNNGSPVYLNFFGVDRDFTITGVSNIEPTKVKIFLTHSIHSNRIPNFVLLNILSSAMYPLGMESELKPANYALREGVYYADIKRDAFTKGVPLTVQARREQIASGRPLRGQSVTFKMTWDGNDYVVVFTSGIGVVPSELS